MEKEENGEGERKKGEGDPLSPISLLLSPFLPPAPCTPVLHWYIFVAFYLHCCQLSILLYDANLYKN